LRLGSKIFTCAAEANRYHFASQGERLVTDLSKITCIEDLRRVAQRRVPRMFYDYAE
jgi:hypothetical protein